MRDKKSPLQHLYPFDYELDYLDKSKFWQTIPNLPSMNIKLIRDSYKNINVSGKYKNRNLKIKPLNF